MSALPATITLPTKERQMPMEYNYVLTTHYDGNYYSSHRFTDALTAVNAFNKCVDWGDAKEYATYNLLEPNGKMHTLNFYRNGEVNGK